jgi:hypothetical protein
LAGKHKVVKQLLASGANWKIGEKDGYTCMHGAAFQGPRIHTQMRRLANVHAALNLKSRQRNSIVRANLTCPFLSRATQGGCGGNQCGILNGQLDSYQITNKLGAELCMYFSRGCQLVTGIQTVTGLSIELAGGIRKNTLSLHASSLSKARRT